MKKVKKLIISISMALVLMLPVLFLSGCVGKELPHVGEIYFKEVYHYQNDTIVGASDGYSIFIIENKYATSITIEKENFSLINPDGVKLGECNIVKFNYTASENNTATSSLTIDSKDEVMIVVYYSYGTLMGKHTVVYNSTTIAEIVRE